MSSVMKPVGPEDPQVYWKRRALVGGIVLVVLLLIWFVVFRSSGSEPPPADTSSSPTLSRTPSTSPSGSASASESESASASASPTSTLSGACADSDIGVTVSTDAETYPSGVDPQITLTIANDGSTACQRDVGSAANSIEISSGGVRVWSSDDCSTDSSEDIATLQPGQRATVTVTWPRTMSAAGCPTPAEDQSAAEPGFYDAVGTNGEVSSKKVSFTLD